MWKNVTRASGRYDCRLDWCAFNVEPLPLAQDVPFDRVAPAAEKKRFRHSRSVSISKVLGVRSCLQAKDQTECVDGFVQEVKKEPKLFLF
jgi:hypothetical protein